MKIVQFHTYGSPNVLQLQDASSPTLQKNELLVKVHAAAINPKDILIRKGKFKRMAGSKFPKGVGFDFAGTVANTNAHKNYPVGTPVYGMINGWNARCCAEYINVPVNELYHSPKNCNFIASASIPLAAQTALQALRDQAQLKAGQTVCINGASGGVGTLAIQIAKALNGQVTTISSHRNLDLCRSLGADNVIDYTETLITATGQKFDIFFDVFGNYSFPKIRHLLHPNGYYVTTVPNIAIIKEQFFNPFRRQKAKLVVVKSRKTDLQWLTTQIETGVIQPVVDKVYPLPDIAKAQAYIETKRARGKVVVQIIT